MSDGLEHFSDLLRAPFAQLHFEPAVAFVFAATRGLHAIDVARERALSIECDAALEFLDDALVRNAAHFDVIRLDGSMLRMGDLVGELAVVGQKDEAFRLK